MNYNVLGIIPKEEKEKKGRIRNFIRSWGYEILNNIEQRQREIENAYLDGMSMFEAQLVMKFKKAKGLKRKGYEKALEERRLLERDYEGNLKPTELFKRYY